MPALDTELKEAIREKWDESSQSYDSFHGHGIKSKEEHDAWKNVFETVLPKGRLKILDVGCGTGEISLLLAEMGYQITGVDLSDKMLSIARSKAKASRLKAQFLRGDAESLNFDDESFDAVISRHLLWTLPHPDSALREWKRVLKNGGRVVIIDGLWMDGSLENKLWRLISDLSIIILERQNPRKGWYSKKTEAELPHPHGMDAQRAMTYLEEAGFDEIDQKILDDIKDLQRKHMPFSQKVTYNANYYMIYGKK
ncbi:MAG: class I SAM-dependent methyltransferase [Methanotrichaceae archaeon]